MSLCVACRRPSRLRAEVAVGGDQAFVARRVRLRVAACVGCLDAAAAATRAVALLTPDLLAELRRLQRARGLPAGGRIDLVWTLEAATD